MSLSNGKLIRDDELKLSKALKTVLDIQKTFYFLKNLESHEKRMNLRVYPTISLDVV